MAKKVFATKFGPNVVLSKPKQYGVAKNYLQFFSGIDTQTGFNMTDVNKFFGPSVLEVQCITDKDVTEETVQNYLYSSIVQDVGPLGRLEHILRQNIKQRATPAGSVISPQIQFLICRNGTRGLAPLPLREYYYSMWFKLDAKLDEKLIIPAAGPGGSGWYSLAEVKTGGWGGDATFGDFRHILGVFKDADGLYYKIAGDNAANGLGKVPGITAYNIATPYWKQRTKSGSVKLGVWQKLEVYIKKPIDCNDLTSGVAWYAITQARQQERIVIGHKLGGKQMGDANLPDTRIFLGANYSGGNSPIVTDFTDLEIWDGLPFAQSARFNNNTMKDF